jgi:hypothetical protein
MTLIHVWQQERNRSVFCLVRDSKWNGTALSLVLLESHVDVVISFSFCEVTTIFVFACTCELYICHTIAH